MLMRYILIRFIGYDPPLLKILQATQRIPRILSCMSTMSFTSERSYYGIIISYKCQFVNVFL